MERQKEDNLRAVWFAAGTLVVAACLQRAAVVSLVEQWRVWVFLALNLLLLAILFTSTSPKTSAIHEGIDNGVQNTMNEKENGRMSVPADEDGDGGVPQTGGGDDGGAESTTDQHQLSKEELNEKVEAFIAMFRQQLVSDAANRSSRVACSAGAKQHFD